MWESCAPQIKKSWGPEGISPLKKQWCDSPEKCHLLLLIWWSKPPRFSLCSLMCAKHMLYPRHCLQLAKKMMVEEKKQHCFKKNQVLILTVHCGPRITLVTPLVMGTFAGVVRSCRSLSPLLPAFTPVILLGILPVGPNRKSRKVKVLRSLGKPNKIFLFPQTENGDVFWYFSCWFSCLTKGSVHKYYPSVPGIFWLPLWIREPHLDPALFFQTPMALTTFRSLLSSSVWLDLLSEDWGRGEGKVRVLTALTFFFWASVGCPHLNEAPISWHSLCLALITFRFLCLWGLQW